MAMCGWPVSGLRYDVYVPFWLFLLAGLGRMGGFSLFMLSSCDCRGRLPEIDAPELSFLSSCLVW